MAVLRLALSLVSLAFLIMPLVYPSDGKRAVVAVEEADLKAKLLEPPFQLPKVYDDAINALDSIQRATICHQTAAGDLIFSCKALETSSDVQDCALDHIKASFSARLALCELVDARASIPEDCQKLLDKTKPKMSFSAYFGAANEPKQGSAMNDWDIGPGAQEQTSKCIAALGSRTQWWMSYSNARQNVFAICHASRSAVDREDALAAHRAITGITSEYGQAMDHTLKMQQDFARKVEALQNQLLEDAHTASSYLRQLFNDLEVRISSFLGAAKNGTQEVHKELNKMTSSIQNASGEVQDALAHVRHNDVSELSNALGSVQRDLSVVAQAAADMAEQQQHHRTWIEHISGAFAQVSSNHAALQTMQHEQFDDIARMMQALATAIQAHDQGLQTLTAKMDGLGAVIDDKAAIMASVDIGNLSRIFLQTMFLVIVLLAASLCGARATLPVAVMGLCYLLFVANPTLGRLVSATLEVPIQPFVQIWMMLLSVAVVVSAAAYGAHLYLTRTRRAAAHAMNDDKDVA